MRRVRARLTYANVVATLALLFAMSGGALAASHYVISSPKQIKPSVLKKLRGKTGSRGAVGVKGQTGNTGVQGVPGVPGMVGPRGESGPQSLGAIDVDTTTPPGSPMLVSLDGISIESQCGADVDLAISATNGGGVQMAGTESLDGFFGAAPTGSNAVIAAEKAVDLDAIGRDSTEASFARFDLHGEKVGTACHYWGVAIPLT